MALEKEEGEERKEKQPRKRERARDLLYRERGARGEGRREGEKRKQQPPRTLGSFAAFTVRGGGVEESE